MRGSVPDQLGECVHLEELELQHNQLTGSIPSTFIKLTKLRVLNLESNSFAGQLDDDLFEAMTDLQVLQHPYMRIRPSHSLRLPPASDARPASE